MTSWTLLYLAAAGIGRFLRLTVSNIRLRIAYEDFPSTQRLVAMVQVGWGLGTWGEGGGRWELQSVIALFWGSGFLF